MRQHITLFVSAVNWHRLNINNDTITWPELFTGTLPNCTDLMLLTNGMIINRKESWKVTELNSSGTSTSRLLLLLVIAIAKCQRAIQKLEDNRTEFCKY